MTMRRRARGEGRRPLPTLSAIGAAAALLLVGLPEPRVDASLVHAFGPGEVLVYDVSYGPVHTGRARVAVGADRVVDDHTVWPIVVQAHTSDVFSKVFEVRDQVVSFWTPKEHHSIGFDMHAIENGDHRFTRMRLHPEEGRAVVERRRPDGTASTRRYEVGGVRQDVASAIFWLRTRRLAVGDRETVGLFTGSKTWDLVATVEGREAVEAPAGRYDTLRVRLQTRFHGRLAAKRDIVVWMTDEPAHIPVRAQAELVLGSIHADLASYLPGLAR